MIHSMYIATAGTCSVGFTLQDGTCDCDPVLQNTLTSVILIFWLETHAPIIQTFFDHDKD